MKSQRRKMGAYVKVVSFAVLSVLLLQLHAVHSSEPSKDPSEIIKTLDETEKNFSTEVDNHLAAADNYVKQSIERIKSVNNSQMVQRVLNKSMGEAKLNVRAMRMNMQRNICDRVRDVKELTRSTSPTADIAEFINTPEYQRTLEEGASKLDRNMLMRLSDRLGGRNRHEILIRLNRNEKPPMAKLAEWQKYFATKSEWAHKIHDEAMERLREASAYTLHTLRDAVAVWSGDKEGLTAKKETPSDAAQKALLIGAALGINNLLQCDE